MKAAVCVPFRPSDPHRQAAWDYVRTHIERMSLGPIVTADSGHQPFSRAGSRNQAATSALVEHRPDVLVLVFHDADTILATADQYRRLCHIAADTGRFTIGANREYLALNADQTHAVLHDHADPWAQKVVHPDRLRNVSNSWFPVGGVVALTVNLWYRVGGYDERFTGWGCEDVAIARACRWLTGETAARAPGDMLQLYHPRHQALDPANNRLWERYGDCGSSDSMLNLLTEPGGPLHRPPSTQKD